MSPGLRSLSKDEMAGPIKTPQGLKDLVQRLASYGATRLSRATLVRAGGTVPISVRDRDIAGSFFLRSL